MHIVLFGSLISLSYQNEIYCLGLTSNYTIALPFLPLQSHVPFPHFHHWVYKVVKKGELQIYDGYNIGSIEGNK
jgi:hypothetical protein